MVVYPPRPRNEALELDGALSALTPRGVTKVGLFVDADADTVAAALAGAPLDLLQFHGDESPERVAAVKRRFGKPVMKAIAVAAAADLAAAQRYFGVADRLVFDAKPPKDAALPGGNGLIFDWELLGARRWPLPWMLSGVLPPDNLVQAYTITQ